jgi:hypothetical protein
MSDEPPQLPRMVRGQSLREMSERDLDSLQAQIAHELAQALATTQSLSEQLKIVEAELWQRH